MLPILEAQMNYGPIRKGRDYAILDEGSDWMFVKLMGRGIYVFKWVFYGDKND